MKTILSGAVIATAIVACLTVSTQAKPINILSSTVSVSDTGKMAMNKMKKDKMKMEKKKDKMKNDKMKMDKKMGKMKKDSTGKM